MGKYSDASREHCTCGPQKCITVVGHKRNAPMLATYMLLWKKDGGENNLQPFSPMTTIIVTIYNITDIATTITIVKEIIIFLTDC